MTDKEQGVQTQDADSYVSQYGGSSAYSTRKFFIEVVNDAGEVIERWKWATTSDFYFNEACSYFEKVGTDTVRIPQKHAKYKYVTVTKRALPCAYTATESYCKTMFGFNLTPEDKDFFTNHPLVEEDGLPLPSTLRVIQEVISVYGLRVSRVRLAPGTFIRGDLTNWVKWLGINPLALADKVTDNRTFAERMGMSIDATHRMYRLEYSESALRPSIACGQFGTTVVGSAGVTGFTGGHAQFLPPRGRDGAAIMSIQLARVEVDPWGEGCAPSYDTSLVEPVSQRTFTMFETVDAARSAGLPRKVVPGVTYTPTYGAVPETSNKRLPARAGKDTKRKERLKVCDVCRLYETEQRIGAFIICEVCWYALWKNSQCNKTGCKEAFEHFPPAPSYVSLKERNVAGSCRKCKSVWELDEGVKHAAQRVSLFMRLLEQRNAREIPKDLMKDWDLLVTASLSGSDIGYKDTDALGLLAHVLAKNVDKNLGGGSVTQVDGPEEDGTGVFGY